jgi:hypothetical protein
MSVYVNNLSINCGENFTQSLTIQDSDGTALDLTGYGGSSYIRKHPESSTVVASFGVNFTDRNNGIIELSLPSASIINVKEGRYVYDVLLTKPSGLKLIVVEGSVLLRAGIST